MPLSIHLQRGYRVSTSAHSTQLQPGGITVCVHLANVLIDLITKERKGNPLLASVSGTLFWTGVPSHSVLDLAAAWIWLRPLDWER